MSRDKVLNGLTRHSDDLVSAYKRGGKKAVREEIEKHIERIPDWGKIPLKIGVIGRSGTGKSSFLNAIRVQREHDELDEARVGVVETTTSAQEFPHPQNRKLIFCDLPGAGTSEFPLEKYVQDKRIRFYKFDMIIVIFSSRFTESEVHFLLSVVSNGIFCMFVRTKVGLDIDNERKTKRRQFATDPDAIRNLVKKIRKDCEDNLKDLPGRVPIFLIDNFDHENEHLDYAVLSSHLTDGFSEMKKEAFVKMAAHDFRRQYKEAEFGKQREEQQTQQEACSIQ